MSCRQGLIPAAPAPADQLIPACLGPDPSLLPASDLFPCDLPRDLGGAGGLDPGLDPGG